MAFEWALGRAAVECWMVDARSNGAAGIGMAMAYQRPCVRALRESQL